MILLEKKITVRHWLSYFLFVNLISFRSVWMRKSSWFGTFVFSFCLLVLFPFGLGTEALQRQDVRLGSLWMINEFIAVLTVGRMFFPEQETGALDVLLASRGPRSALLAGKMSFTALQIFSFQIPVLFFWFFLYNVPSGFLVSLFLVVLPVSLLFNLGTASLGSTLSCVTSRSLAKDILFPMLFFPLQSSLLLAAVSLSIKLGGEQKLLGAWSPAAWWTVLALFPLVFATLGFLLSPILFQE